LRKRAAGNSTPYVNVALRARRLAPRPRPFVMAEQISRNIGNVGVSIRKFSELSKSSDPFKDCETRIEDMSATIKLDIDTLKSQIDDLPRVSTDWPSAHERAHMEQIIEQLRARLTAQSQAFKNLLVARSDVWLHLQSSQVAHPSFAEPAPSAGTTRPVLREHSCSCVETPASVRLFSFPIRVG